MMSADEQFPISQIRLLSLHLLLSFERVRATFRRGRKTGCWLKFLLPKVRLAAHHAKCDKDVVTLSAFSPNKLTCMIDARGCKASKPFFKGFGLIECGPVPI